MGNESSWSEKEKLIARLISWGIIVSVVVIITGGIWTFVEFIAQLFQPSLSWFSSLDWPFQILVIGALIIGLIVGIVGFNIFVRRGQRFILHLLFKIND
jgi:hypothetical protein